jgi:glycosyltransferase involved in cell wall biosynthesis
MSRPTVSLSIIAKNEAHNIGPMFQSVKGCIDEIIFVDTGSTDGTLEFVDKINEHIANGSPEWAGLPQIKVSKFEWVDDFAKARQFGMDQCTCDYMLWLDCDDRLSDAKAFINWRDTVLHAAHYWMAVYNYAFRQDGTVECKFVRERVVKLNHGFKWKYFVHEGLVQEEDLKYWPQAVSSWCVNHARSEDDKKADHLRNVNLLNKYKGELPARMKFYQGKELTENGFNEEGCQPLLEAIASPDLEIHDRILAIQYAAQNAFHAKAYAQAIDLLTNGTKLMINRAEYWCLLGDVYCATGRLGEAIQSYKVALNCTPDNLGGIVVIYDHAYGEYPMTKLCELMMATGRLDEAAQWLAELKKVGSPRVPEFEMQLNKLVDLSTVRLNLAKTEDVIITCPPGAMVTDWDEFTEGAGGSETAAIEVARWIKKKTNRNVKIFHQRKKRDVMPSGVEYQPSSELAGYLQNVEPRAHIAWRHSVKLTNAKTFVWCHDLQCQGAEQTKNYDKIVALSGFHKEYLKETNGVPEDKIVLGFNGINPDDFVDPAIAKDSLKVVFSSSPDRGLVQTIDIVKKAREISGLDIKLHCFYGFENMRKAGHVEWADSIEKKIKENDFVEHHGKVSKKTLVKHFKEAAVWLYPADFIETYCITAIEALCAGTWPIVRPMGALPYTLKDAISKDMCDLVNFEANTEANVGIWANVLTEAIIDKKWRRVDVSPADYSWEKVGDFFIKEMEL